MNSNIKNFIHEQVKNVINETINDNLHQFINYIKSSGKFGTLKSDCRNLHDAIGEINARYYVVYALDYEFSEYCEENGYDEEDYDLKAKFISNEMQKTLEFILSSVTINNNGLIYIERNIKIPNLLKVGELGYDLNNKYGGHLGIYWSYISGQVIDATDGVEISFKGWVRPEDIDWEATVSANICCPDEYEITLEYDTPIQIDVITIIPKRGHTRTIWNKPIILQA